METRTIRTIGKRLRVDNMRASKISGEEIMAYPPFDLAANSNASRYGGLWKSKALRNGDVSVKTPQFSVSSDSKA